jgi:Ca-activated chloride channel family protein
MAKSLKIPVYSILVGRGGKVPFPVGTDFFGQPAYREMEIAINPALLQEISKTTGGEYYRATDSDELRSELQKVLDSLERTKLLEGGASAHYDERFQPYLMWALIFGALELLLRTTWLRVTP